MRQRKWADARIPLTGPHHLGRSSALPACIGLWATRAKARGRLLSPDESAVDRNDCTRHIVGQIGRQKLDDLGAILDRTEPPKGDQFGPITIALNAPRNDRRHDPPCSDHTGCDTVHRDPELAEILRQIPRVVGNSGLRGPIMG